MRNLNVCKLMFLLFIVGLLMNSCREDELFVPVSEEGTSQTSLLKSAVTVEYLTGLIGKIETLVSEGSLSEGAGKSLIAKMENAIRSIQNGNINAMKGQLNALIHQVEGLIARGELTPEEGEPLIDGAESQMILTEGSFTDARDGHVYKVVQIGSQLWMAENLAYLPSVSPPVSEISDWTKMKFWVYGYEGTDVAVAKITANYTAYGVLYNWSAAMNEGSPSNEVPSGVRGICPAGWHIPSHQEWNDMETYLGGYEVAGNKLKESGTEHWNSPNYGATNESGFTGLPGGYHKHYDTPYVAMGSNGYWWTSTQADETDPLSHIHAWIHFLYAGPESFSEYFYKDCGISVRCVKN